MFSSAKSSELTSESNLQHNKNVNDNVEVEEDDLYFSSSPSPSTLLLGEHHNNDDNNSSKEGSSTSEKNENQEKEENDDDDKPKIAIPISFMILLFTVSAAQDMSTSLLTLLFAKTLEPQQTTYFWTFMSWVYWFSPVSGWVSDVCGSRKILLLVGMVFNILAWCLTTWEAGDDYTLFVVFGVLQNAAMLFVNSAMNGALVEVVKSFEEIAKKKLKKKNSSRNTSEQSALSLAVPPSPTSASAAAVAADVQQQNDDDEESDHDEQNEHDQETSSLIHNTNEDNSDKNNNNKEKQHKEATMLSKSGDTQSTAMLARSLGSVIGAVIETFALVKLEIREALAISISIYCLATIIAIFADFSSPAISHRRNKNKKGNSSTTTRPDTESFFSRIKSVFDRLRLLCDTKTGEGQSSRSAAVDVAILLTFIFCNSALPDASSFYMSYVFDAFSYPNWFNSTYQFASLLGALIGCEIYRRFLAKHSQTRVFFVGCFFAAISYLTGLAFCTGFTRDTLHINNAAYLMVDAILVGFLNRLAFMPILHVASVRCPKGFEAVVFELFSLAALGGSTVSSLIAIRIANALGISRKNWSQLWVLIVIAAVSRLVPMIVVPYLPPPPAAATMDIESNGTASSSSASSVVDENENREDISQEQQ